MSFRFRNFFVLLLILMILLFPLKTKAESFDNLNKLLDEAFKEYDLANAVEADAGCFPGVPYEMPQQVVVACGILVNRTGGGGSGLPSNLGWSQLTNTKIAPLCPSDAQFPGIQGNTGCAAVTTAWGDCIPDFARNRLICLGGGHSDYFGNEIYALDMNAVPPAMLRIKDPSSGNNVTGAGGCPEQYLDGFMSARHGFGGDQYIAFQDLYLIYGGGLPHCGSFTNTYWNFNPNNFTWNKYTVTANAPNRSSSGGIPLTGINQTTNMVYDIDPNEGGQPFKSWNPATNVWTVLNANTGNKCGAPTNSNAVVDEKRGYYVCIGQGNAAKFNTTTGVATAITDASCTTAISGIGSGVDYDTDFQDIVIMRIDSTLWSMNLDTGAGATCTQLTGFPGTPPAGADSTYTGPLKRFRFMRNSHVFAFVRDINTNAYIFRRTASADSDYLARCSAPGVIACPKFPDSMIHNKYLFPGTDGTTFADCDTSTYTSGTCSLHFPVPAVGGANVSGSYSYPFSTNGNASGQVNFQQNSTFYFQFRQKFDAAYLSNNWKTSDGSSTNWKQVDFHYGNPDTGFLSSCGNIEITTRQYVVNGFPIIYGQCGGQGYFVPTGSSDFFLEQGTSASVGYNCLYSTRTGCFIYPANTWLTFYYRVDIGTWGAGNSKVQAWVALPGGAYVQFINFPNAVLNIDSAQINAFNYFSFFPYMTGRDSGHPVASASNTWYDEPIASTQPIAAPAALPKN